MASLDKDALGELAIPLRRSLSDDVVDRLRSAIIRGEFGPDQRLSEAALADAFGVSRGPIREALTQLEREGLLKVERHRGARVTRLSKEDIDEIYSLRTVMERLAIERAARFADEDDFAAMEGVVEELKAAVAASDARRTVELDAAFHDLVYRAARHSRLYLAWSALRPQIETFLHSRSTDTQDYFTKALHEHVALLKIIRAREPERAIEMIEEHLRTAYVRLSEMQP
ncbi:GntR family transcriptional regulator [Vulcanimicrobium alpinum]|uniref:GntR family transcriptional regulator n=1 Tax=Vulcanimicrobium alpinum TaxID=3016050 RepID=A0AAN1Y0R9_UNVUL|nr:GntR family transcriptional regulator [Vulcanimicrobium alpinum]